MPGDAEARPSLVGLGYLNVALVNGAPDGPGPTVVLHMNRWLPFAVPMALTEPLADAGFDLDGGG